MTSARRSRPLRLLDMLSTAVRERSSYDVANIDVYSGAAFFWAEAAAATLRVLGKPYIVTLRGGGLPEFSARWPRRVRHLLRSATAATAPSEFMVRAFRGVRPDLLLIPNSVDLSRYEFRPRSRLSGRLMWLRAFHEVYDPSMAVEVLAAVAARIPDATLTMAGGDKGDGSRERTLACAERLGVLSRVRLTGQVEKPRVPAVLQDGDVFLNTTKMESYGVSVMEAAACGLCIVTTNAGGIPSIWTDGFDTLQVPVGDRAAMAAAVLRVIDDPELASQLSERARHKAEAVDWSTNVPKWEALLLRAGKRPERPRVRLAAGARQGPTGASPVVHADSAAQSSATARPGLLLVGNLLSRMGSGRAVCEDLGERLSDKGWPVLLTSGRRNRLVRLLEMLTTTLCNTRRYAVAQLDVYSGPAFSWAQAVAYTLSALRKPFVVMLHGGALPEFSRRNPSRVRNLLSRATAVAAPSAYMVDSFRLLRPDIVLIPNSIDVGLYPFRPRESPAPRMIWLRALHSVYAPWLAVEALAGVIGEFPGATLTMVGADKRDGSLARVLETADRLGVSEKLRLTGLVPKSDIPALLDESDIFLNTATIDNSPLSLIEAAACGLCIVTTGVGGTRHVWSDGQDAVLVPPRDPAAMVGGVCRLLRDAVFARQLSVNARRKAEQMDWSVTLPVWEELFSRTAAIRSRPEAGKGSGSRPV